MDWLQDILAPLIVLLIAGFGSVIGWFVKSKDESSRAIQQKLNEERRKTYSEILSPLILILSNVKSKEGATGATQQILKDLPKFQKNRVDLVLFGSDNVVKAHNSFLAYMYKVNDGKDTGQKGENTMKLWGKLLLEIRKDVGNKNTKLDELDMLRWLITDVDKLKD